MNFNSRPQASQLNSFLGLPSDGGMHSVANQHPYGNDFNVQHGSAEGPRGGEAAGTAVTGPGGNTYARGAAVGPDGGVVAGRGVEGAGGGVAGQGVAVGPGGRGVAGGGVVGPEGNSAGRAAAWGPNGAAAGYGYRTPSDRYTNASAVRSNFYGNTYNTNIYGRGWYTDHPGAWYAAGWAAGSMWNAATWGGLNDWFGYAVPPVSYDYGSSVVYQNDQVYVNGQDEGTADQYYQQAQTLASAGATSQASPDDQWMALGVFAASKSGDNHPIATIQLAVDKAGMIGGNFTVSSSGTNMPVHGSVDKQTQRVAFTIGDNKDTVIETGLYNLTKDEATALVHRGSGQTEQWEFVRLQQPTQSGSQDAPASQDQPAAADQSTTQAQQ